MKRVILFLLLCSLFTLPIVAQDDHDDHHHEDLTATQLGTVHFPVACAKDVQKPFERGVALLHSFWYEEAEKQFQQVAAADPHCAMAHWGVAMSLWHQLWGAPSDSYLERGTEEIYGGWPTYCRHHSN